MSFHSRSECQLFCAGCAVQLMIDYFFQNLRKNITSSQCFILIHFPVLSGEIGLDLLACTSAEYSLHVYGAHQPSACELMCPGRFKGQFCPWNLPAHPPVLMNTRQSCLSSTKIFLNLMPQLEIVNLAQHVPQVFQIVPGDFCPCPLAIPGTRS